MANAPKQQSAEAHLRLIDDRLKLASDRLTLASDRCKHDWRESIAGRTKTCRKCGRKDYTTDFLEPEYGQ